jgi:hypothetical protein
LVRCQRPDGVSLCQVSRVTRAAATIIPAAWDADSPLSRLTYL